MARMITKDSLISDYESVLKKVKKHLTDKDEHTKEEIDLIGQIVMVMMDKKNLIQ